MPDSAPVLPAASQPADPLDKLLLAMQRGGDFPALSASVARIVEITGSDSGSAAELAEQILADVTLTHKLLRLVNSVHHAQASQGNVASVARAVVLVGFNAVRNLALGLVLLEHVPDQAQAARMKLEFLRALLAATVAGELCAVRQDVEEVFLGAMFQNLGRLLAGYYFPHEAAEVRRLQAVAQLSEEAASARVLGLHYEGFGAGVARLWGLPEPVLRYLRKPVGAPPIRRVESAAERMRWLVLAANELADQLAREPVVPAAAPPAAPAPGTAVQQARTTVRRWAERFGHALGQRPEAMEQSVAAALAKLRPMLQSLQLGPPAGAALEALLAAGPARPDAGG